MASTGATSLADAADKIAVDHPYIPKKALEELRAMNALFPYVFDATQAYSSDGTNYPGGTTSVANDSFLITANLATGDE